MLHIVCINAGNYQGQGVRYVNMLHDMVRRNLPQTVNGKFLCLTEPQGYDATGFAQWEKGYDPGVILQPLPSGLEGWWHKMWLFSREFAERFRFPQQDRIIYFDLDTIIIGALDDIVKYSGEFATLSDFNHPQHYNTSVMMWRPGFGAHIWDGWDKAGRPIIPGGDQIAIWHQHRAAERLQELYPRAFISYKQSARFSLPEGAKVVCFHGHPKPPEIKTGWVPEAWALGGISLFDLKLHGNLEANKVIQNVRRALSSGLPFIKGFETRSNTTAVVVAGGPSLKDANVVEEIRALRYQGAAVVALNNSWRWLAENQIKCDYHVMLDARDENLEYVPPEIMSGQRLYAAQCSPLVFENSPKDRTRVWLPHYDGLPELLLNDGIEGAYFGGGTTVGLLSLVVLAHIGFKAFHLYGYDSSYVDGAHHAYAQPANDGDAHITVKFDGRSYETTPWMVAQCKEFREVSAALVNERGCEIYVHGSGLLPAIAHHMARYMPEGSIEKRNGVYYPAFDVEGSTYGPQELLDLPKILTCIRGRDVCVQAGGNVGLWPREFAKHFKEVLTFEPDETNFKCLSLNIKDVKNVRCYQGALGNHDGEITFERDPKNCGAHHVGERGDWVQLYKIDNFNLPACDLIQLDIEGYEYIALKGAKETITKFHPVIVVEEKGHGEKYGIAEDAISCFLSDLGYIFVAAIGRDAIYHWQPSTEKKNE